MHTRMLQRAITGLIALTVTSTLVVGAPAQGATSDVDTLIRNAEAAVPAASAFTDTSTAAPALTDSGAISLGGLEVTAGSGARASTAGELALSEGPSVTYAADDLGEATRFSAVLEDSSARASWTFRGADLQQFDGFDTISVVKGDELVGVIEAPWAVDADGNAVPTHYEVRGPKLIQVVETDASTAFPVVADPTYRQRSQFSWDILFNKGETGLVIGTLATCARFLGGLAHPYAAVAATACFGLATISGAQLARGYCLAVRVTLPRVVYPYWYRC